MAKHSKSHQLLNLRLTDNIVRVVLNFLARACLTHSVQCTENILLSNIHSKYLIQASLEILLMRELTLNSKIILSAVMLMMRIFQFKLLEEGAIIHEIFKL